ncbi:hypothetical protein [Nocardia sp. NPDC058666]|uniref:hypothetical protein n=1 Tax=Nocardia sp. NPDC058666 TaxID=3346587 RepID=UPI00365F8158
MHADIDGALRIGQLAADFDWQWTNENSDAFCRVAQLQVDHEVPDRVILKSMLTVDPSAGFVLSSKGLVSRKGYSPHSVMQLYVNVT